MEVLIAQYGYAAIYALLMLGIVGLPVPDETLLALSGHLVQSGTLRLAPAFASALLGSMTGITVSYLIGRTGGVRLVHKYGARFHLTPERLERAHGFFERAGHWSLVAGYFIPGVRHFVALVAGTSGLEAHVFAVFAYSGAVVWVSTFLSLGYFLSYEWIPVMKRLHEWSGALLLAALLGLLIWFGLRRRNQSR